MSLALRNKRSSLRKKSLMEQQMDVLLFLHRKNWTTYQSVDSKLLRSRMRRTRLSTVLCARWTCSMKKLSEHFAVFTYSTKSASTSGSCRGTGAVRSARSSKLKIMEDRYRLPHRHLEKLLN